MELRHLRCFMAVAEATEIAGDRCEPVLEALVSEGYLTRVHDGRFGRRSEP
jgi:hypothetical protein